LRGAVDKVREAQRSAEAEKKKAFNMEDVEEEFNRLLDTAEKEAKTKLKKEKLAEELAKASAEYDSKPNPSEMEAVDGRVKRCLELERETADIKIKTVAFGRKTVEIRWFFKKSFEVSKMKLFGFRAEDAFSLNEFSKTENGTLIVNEARNGRHLEHLEIGKTYFYTFILTATRLQKTGSPLENVFLEAIHEATKDNDNFPLPYEEKNIDSIRFTLRTPKEGEIQDDSDKEKSSRQAEEIERILKGLTTKREKKSRIFDYEANERENIKSRKYPSDRERYELDELEKACEEARFESEIEKGTVE